MRARRQLGERTLRLLAEGCTVAVLRELTAGPARPVELERRLPGQAHTSIMRALANLALLAALTRERRGGVPHSTIYALTDAGEALVEIPAAAARWERRHAPAGLAQGEPGLRPLRLLADPHTRAIALTLAERALTLTELHAACPSALGVSALRKRLARLSREGIVLRARSEAPATYELAARARRLARASMLAGRWEGLHRPARDAAPASDLASALRVIVPLARVAPSCAGACRLNLAASAGEPTLPLAVADGGLRTLPHGPRGAGCRVARHAGRLVRGPARTPSRDDRDARRPCARARGPERARRRARAMR